MKKHKVEYIQKRTEKLESITCDVCKENIPQGKIYFEVTTHHDHWGRDSGDSFEYYDLCNRNCLSIHMTNYISECDVSGYSYDIETEKAIFQ